MEIKAKTLEAIKNIKGINDKIDIICLYDVDGDEDYVFKNKSYYDVLMFVLFLTDIDLFDEDEDLINDFFNKIKTNSTMYEIKEFINDLSFTILKDNYPKKENDFEKWLKNIKVIKPTKIDKDLVLQNMKTLEHNRKEINIELAKYREELKEIEKYLD